MHAPRRAARYGFGQQSLDCDFCMATMQQPAEQVILRGQTGTDDVTAVKSL